MILYVIEYGTTVKSAVSLNETPFDNIISDLKIYNVYVIKVTDLMIEQLEKFQYFNLITFKQYLKC